MQRTSLLLWIMIFSISGTDSRAEDFESTIAPVLTKRCVECHNDQNTEGGLNLTDGTHLQTGGDSGPVISPRNATESYLFQRVRDGEMPPQSRGQSQKLPDEEIKALKLWIEEGAQWPADRKLDLFERSSDVRAGRDWWSLQPIVKSEVPTLAKFEQPENPIDAFVLVSLEAEQMSPAPAADKRLLIRRLYYDLIGLPPTQEEIQAFLANRSPEAWTELIDSLLAKPQYGERWGRYWLDLARFAETSGYERDQEKEYAWKYRDWVVNAFNSDMPYSQFIIEQIAGDEVENRTEQSVIATGFLRLGTWNDEPNEPLDYEYDRLEDLVHTTSSTFLGLTVKCARCHTHKFDPILQDDYYRMASAFWPGPIAARDRELLGGPSAEEVGFENVLAWTDINTEPRPLHVLKNGERTHPLHEVVPASLSSIPELYREFSSPPEGAKTTRRRLQLAKWIADSKNPLTPRVLVNRLWQHHFGQAIVRTPDNFGFLADPPTHPHLLDWLAAEFLEHGGSIKHIHRLILTSQTWQQSSIHPQQSEYELRDSSNRLWWRADRRRLDAEALRDSILFATGDLEFSVGGESFKATVNPEALEGLSRKESAWQAAPEDEQKRRSIYMYLKRGLLPPMMTAFDLCDATQTTGQRDVTTVPTQALALLNNQFVHAESESLAEKVAAQAPDVDTQIRQVWSKVLRRDPTERELALAKEHLSRQKSRFAQPVNRESDFVPTNVSAEAIQKSLAWHLRADAVTTSSNESRIQSVQDLSAHGRNARQDSPEAQPTLMTNRWNGRPAIHFNGQGQFLQISGQPVSGQELTIICVVSDDASTGHREVISNWNSADNVGSSLFLGLTDEKTVRFSDVFANAGEIVERHRPFILSVVNGNHGAAVFQSGRVIGSQTSPLSQRKLDTPWVIGQQGNINGEFWHGDIAEIRVYDRALSNEERRSVESELAERYGLNLHQAEKPELRQLTPDVLALASLCHVLLNSNEFIYVD